MLTVPPLWPMTTRERSTPSSRKTRCCSSPGGSGGVGVCVVIGAPVARWACATARSTRSTPGVIPGRSEAHFKMPARTPVSPIPFPDLPDEEVHHRLRPPQDGARPAEVEVHRHVVVGVHAGCSDHVDLGDRPRDLHDARYVAAQTDDGEVDERVDPVLLELPELFGGPGHLGGLVPLLRRLFDLRTQHEDVLVHQGAAQLRRVDRSAHRVDLGHRPPLDRPDPTPGRRLIVPAGENGSSGWVGTMTQEAHSRSCDGVELRMVRCGRPRRKAL